MNAHSAEKDVPRHMPCDMGCQPDWHHDDCAIYLPAPPEPPMPDADYDAVRVGDKIRFDPRGGRRWWTVRDRDERFIVATVQAPFQPKGELWYTVVDLTGWQNKRYNGAGNGVVRSSLNTLGGGWDTDDESIAEIIPALHSGEWELSHRRVVSVWSIEHTRVTSPAVSTCRRCGLNKSAAIAGVLCDPPYAGSHDFPTRVTSPGGSDA